MNEWTDGRIDGWLDKWGDEEMDGWVDGWSCVRENAFSGSGCLPLTTTTSDADAAADTARPFRDEWTKLNGAEWRRDKGNNNNNNDDNVTNTNKKETKKKKKLCKSMTHLVVYGSRHCAVIYVYHVLIINSAVKKLYKMILQKMVHCEFPSLVNLVAV